MLVGSSSTGKTRACWEALHLLRRREEPWRLWHPIAPTRPDAALAALADIAPYTVIWLNEAQFYLAPSLGDQVAAELRNVLRDPQRAPVLVLATLWPEHWDSLTTRTAADPHAQARELLDGHRIKVPDAFTGTALAALTDTASADPRLAEAAEHAADGQLTQYLAGVPVLMSRYEDAPPATKALIHAAMDARRLGAGPHIPLPWLAGAAPGYLTEAEWNQSDDDWLEQALTYVTQTCNGIPGILNPVKTGTPRNQRTSAPTGPTAGQRARAGQGPLYQLADYVDQHGRRHRGEMIPPIDFWTAAAAHAQPTDLTALGDAAWARGLYRDAAQLHKDATAQGNPHAAVALVGHLRALYPTDSRPAQWAATRIALDNPRAVAELLRVHRADKHEHVGVLLARNPAAHVALDNLDAVAELLRVLRVLRVLREEAGADEQVTALAQRAATHATLDNPNAVVRLLRELWYVGADEQLTALAQRAATHATLDNPHAVAWLLRVLREAGADEQVGVLLARNPAMHAALDDPNTITTLLKALREAGADEQVTALAKRAATHATLDNPRVVAGLLEALRGAGADQQVTALLTRNPAAHVALDNPNAVAGLLKALREAGADEQVTALIARNPAMHATLDNPNAIARLLQRLWEAGGHEQVTALAERVAAHDHAESVASLLQTSEFGARKKIAALLAERTAAHVALDNPRAVAGLLKALRETGMDVQATALLARNPTAHVALDNPRVVAGLLKALRGAGADAQVTALLARNPAAHAALDNAAGVALLLEALRGAGADAQVTALLARNPATHAALDNMVGVVMLLVALRWAGANEQVTALLARNPAAHATLDNPNAVAGLLKVLRQAGAQEQATAVANRLPLAGRFDEFIGIGDHRERFRFGREPDGSVAAPWAWGDLEDLV
ncbi:hypothetical protein ACFXHD_05975 [Streptomyces hydrogenans]|uniref:hypothetical protein n=1 Tax=Streptomyces hydrogenans TaxID=1873719 RepID=UPI0036B9D396